MVYSEVKSLKWANASHTAIDCHVTFDLIGEVPFTASLGDTYYSEDIFNRCVTGEFGLIAEYVKPVSIPMQSAPTSEGKT